MRTPEATSRNLARPRSSGFSMIEVVLALGIVSFGFVSIMGLLPLGISASKCTLDNSVQTHIARRVVGDVQQTDFLTLTGTTRYFDVQGDEVIPTGGSLTASQQAQIIYWVGTHVATQTTFPRNSSAIASNTSLATVTIQIATNPANRTPTPANSGDPTEQSFCWSPKCGLPIQTYCTFVARNN